MAIRLVLRLLGAFEVQAPQGQITSFEAATARALLAYVAAHHPYPQARTQLAMLLWGADAGPTGLTNLRSALRRVRHAVNLEIDGTEWLLAGRDSVQINPEVDVWVDVAEFDAHFRAVETHEHQSLTECSVCAERQRQMVALFRDDFLSDLDIANELFEQWRTLMQERCRRQVMRALHNLAEYEERSGSLAEAEHYARRQLALEHWNEESHRQLMRVLLATGRRSAAIAQYEICRRVLQSEFGAVPSEETDILHEQLLAGEAPPAVRGLLNPYKGLAAFGAADAAYFFGREQAAKSLRARIENEPLVALLGPSGSGKSSVIFAGLAAALSAPQMDITEEHYPTTRWQVVAMRPGATPLNALVDVLPALGYRPPVAGHWMDLLLRGEMALPHAPSAPDQLGAHAGAEYRGTGDGTADSGAMSSPGLRLRRLLIVDQFEEVFSLCRDGAARSAFIRFLLSSATARSDQPGQVVVLLAMRADFMGQALEDETLAAALQQYSVLLAPMSQQDLRRAIAEPARLQGAIFEPGLVERLLVDVGSEPGQLPLLQFALTTLWLRQQNGWLTHATYDSIGGVRGALAEYTDETYLQLSLPEQQSARHIFLTLVEPGLDTQDVRRTATRAEIGDDQWPIVQRLADARLLVTNRSVDGSETVELAHEALIREWKRLREWMEADRAFRNWHKQMRLAAEHWRQSGYDDGPLLREGRLAEAQRWLSERQGDVTPQAREYVHAGVVLRQRRQSEEEARRAQDMREMQTTAAAARRQADAEIAARRRLTRLTAGMAVASVLALAAVAFAILSHFQSERNALVAQSRRLIAEAINVMDAQPDLALLLGLEAVRLDDSVGSKMDLFTQLDIHPMLGRILHGEASPVHSIGLTDTRNVLISNDKGDIFAWDLTSGERRVVSRSGTAVALATVSQDGRYYATMQGRRITVWETKTAARLGIMDGNSKRLDFFGFTRDGKRLISAGADGRVLLWDVQSSSLVRRLPIEEGRLVLGILNTDGTRLLLSDSPEHPDELLLWDADAGRPLGQPLLGHSDAVHGYAVSPDERLLATASFDGSVRLWDTVTGAAVGEPLEGHDGRVLFVTFSRDGRIVISGGTDSRVLLWDVATHLQLGPPLAGHSNWVRSGGLSPDGSMLTTGDQGGNVLVWNLDKARVLLGHTDRVRSLTLSPDQGTLVTSGFDKQLIVWDGAGQRQRRVINTKHENAIISVSFSPDGLSLVSVDAGGRIGFWDAKTWTLRRPLQQVSDQALIGVAFSPDGQTAAAGGFDGRVRLWDVNTGVLKPQVIQAYSNKWALSVRFDPDGERIVSGGEDGVIKVWDAASGSLIGGPWVAHEGMVTDLAFAEGGALLISAGQDGAIRFWDPESGSEVRSPLITGSTQIWSLGLNAAQPHQLLAMTGDGAIADWDMKRQVLNRPLVRTHIESEEMQVAVGGEKAYLASTRALALVVTLEQEEWAEIACTIANRSLSVEEWRQYMENFAYNPVCD